jgi:hypothetical protein
MPCSRDHVSQFCQKVRISAGSATLTGKKSGSISRIDPRPRAGDEVRRGSLGVGDVVQHGTGGHQIEVSRPDRAGKDVSATEFQPGYVRVGQGEIQVHRQSPPTGEDPSGKPGRHGPVAAANLERSCTWSDARPLDVAAVHRIEQLRHECQPQALAFLMMIKNVLWHTSPDGAAPWAPTAPPADRASLRSAPAGPEAAAARAGLHDPLLRPPAAHSRTNRWEDRQPSLFMC